MRLDDKTYLGVREIPFVLRNVRDVRPNALPPRGSKAGDVLAKVSFPRHSAEIVWCFLFLTIRSYCPVSS